MFNLCSSSHCVMQIGLFHSKCRIGGFISRSIMIGGRGFGSGGCIQSRFLYTSKSEIAAATGITVPLFPPTLVPLFCCDSCLVAVDCQFQDLSSPSCFCFSSGGQFGLLFSFLSSLLGVFLFVISDKQVDAFNWCELWRLNLKNTFQPSHYRISLSSEMLCKAG